LTASVLCLDAGVSPQCFKVKGPSKATLEAINPMQADRVIGRYAIGGAVAATFYLEPAATLDLDLRDASGRLLPIYEYLKSRGGKIIEDEYIVIGGWPVQFLAPGNDLETEAVAEAVATTVEGRPDLGYVPRTPGRDRPRNRPGERPQPDFAVFRAGGAVNRKKLRSILERTGLAAKWQQFERKYLEGANE